MTQKPNAVPALQKGMAYTISDNIEIIKYNTEIIKY